MKTVILVPGPSTAVLMSQECTKPISPVFSAAMRSCLSRPMGDSKPDRPPINVRRAYSLDTLSICGVVVWKAVIADIVVDIIVLLGNLSHS